MKRLFATLAMLAFPVLAQDPNLSVKVSTSGVLRTPTNFLDANSIPTKAALTATSAADRVYSGLLYTNLQSEMWASNALCVKSNQMGSGLVLSNGQWVVVSQGTVTNISVNSKVGFVTNMVATITNLTASDVEAIPDSVQVEVWSNVVTASSITNVMLGTQMGATSNGMAWLSNVVSDLSGYATTGSLAIVSNAVAALQADNTLTNLSFTEGTSNNVSKSGRMGNITFKTNYAATASDSSQWATNAAVTNVNMAGFQLVNLGGLSVTGRLVIGFGVFSDTNDVPAPSSTNVWNVFAVKLNGTNYLMGIDAATNRQWIGGAP